MQPFRFGSKDRELHGIWHPAATGHAVRRAIIFCNPMGQEAVRVHRLYHVLAGRLAALGWGCLRFDWFGTGDSGGDDGDADLNGWIEDLDLASAEARRRAGSEHLTWLGARLGASVACLAGGRTTSPPARLVLWEPVLNGSSYLTELEVRHLRTMDASFGTDHHRQGDRRAGETLGFTIGTAMREDINALSTEALIGSCKVPFVVISRNPELGAGRLAEDCASHGIEAKSERLEYTFDWVSEEALNTALVPAPVLQMLVGLVEMHR